MAHFAKISDENIVLSVLTMDNHEMTNEEGQEVESLGQQWLQTHNNWPAEKWIQTSYNTIENKHLKGGTPFRGNYAGIGYTWDEDSQIFWSKKPYPSWVKHIASASWKSPIGDAPELSAEKQAQNDAGTHRWGYSWNEDNQSWDAVDSLA